MNCRKIKKNLEAYLDGALSDEQKDGFDRHLRECAGCGEYVRERRRWGELLTGSMAKIADNLNPPAAVLDSTKRMAADRTGRKSLTLLGPRRKLAAAAALPALVMILLLVFVPRGDNRKSLPGPDDREAASYVKLTTTRHEGGARNPRTVKRVYVARSNGEDGFLSLEMIRANY